MNGYANADTFFAATHIQNIESLYVAARRMSNSFSLRNLFIDAIDAGMIAGDHLDIENIEFDEILDTVLDD